jgi:hypothetical protein
LFVAPRGQFVFNARINPMETTYKVRGADGKEYGPATLQQLSAWLREGRINLQTEIMRSDVDYWAAAGQYSELKSAAPVPPATPPAFGAMASAQPTAARNDAALVMQLKSGASWFYWIAGLSLINSVVAFTGGSWRFFFGLGITQVFDEVLAAGGVALALNLVILAVFVLFGVFAHKGQLWAFIVGMVLFAMDTVIFLLAQDWIGVGLHALVLFFLFRGAKACVDLNRAA